MFFRNRRQVAGMQFSTPRPKSFTTLMKTQKNLFGKFQRASPNWESWLLEMKKKQRTMKKLKLLRAARKQNAMNSLRRRRRPRNRVSRARVIALKGSCTRRAALNRAAALMTLCSHWHFPVVLWATSSAAVYQRWWALNPSWVLRWMQPNRAFNFILKTANNLLQHPRRDARKSPLGQHPMKMKIIHKMRKAKGAKEDVPITGRTRSDTPRGQTLKQAPLQLFSQKRPSRRSRRLNWTLHLQATRTPKALQLRRQFRYHNWAAILRPLICLLFRRTLHSHFSPQPSPRGRSITDLPASSRPLPTRPHTTHRGRRHHALRRRCWHSRDSFLPWRHLPSRPRLRRWSTARHRHHVGLLSVVLRQRHRLSQLCKQLQCMVLHHWHRRNASDRHLCLRLFAVVRQQHRRLLQRYKLLPL